MYKDAAPLMAAVAADMVPLRETYILVSASTAGLGACCELRGHSELQQKPQC